MSGNTRFRKPLDPLGELWAQSGNMRDEGISFGALCKAVGRQPMTVRTLQTKLGLPVLPDGQYSKNYVRFLQRTIILRVLNVPVDAIKELLTREKRLIELLKADTAFSSPAWFLEQCSAGIENNHCLLLTGFNVGFDPDGDEIQASLDFAGKKKELFTVEEMGEDIHQARDSYFKARKVVEGHIRNEMPTLKKAMALGRRILRRK